MAIELFEKFPSDPSQYDFSNHFKEDVISDGSRYMTWKKTCGTIRNGNISRAEGSADVEWVNDYHGVKVFVLCGWNEKESVSVVVTGWPGVHDPRQAVKSGRWSEKELREINQFNNGNSLEEDFEFP